jgi:polysaccharide biosynthesis/export protein
MPPLMNFPRNMRPPHTMALFRISSHPIPPSVYMRTPLRFLFLLLVLAAGCQSHVTRFDAYQSPNVLTASDTESGHANKLMKLEARSFATIALTNQIEPGWLQCPTNLFRLGPGDMVEIEMLDDTSATTEVTVGVDGKIYYHLLPGTSIWGLTLSEAKELLESKMTNYLRTKPEITLTLKRVESIGVCILGEVNRPGVYSLATPLRLLEAVTLAGGPTFAGIQPGAANSSGAPVAGTVSAGTQAAGPAGSGPSFDTVDWANSFIYRQGALIKPDFQALFRRGDLSQNIYLQPNDFIYLRPLGPQNIYVMGSVFRPGAFPFTARSTLLKAITLAGGPIPLAYGSHVAIVRGSLSQPRVAVVNYRNIAKGKQPDVLLEPEDIIYVPSAPYRYIVQLGDMIIRQFVSTWALNEGSYAVNPANGPVSVTIGNQAQ